MLSDPVSKPFDQVDLLGFAFRRGDARQFHVGILYKLPNKKVHLRHQCTHNVLADQEDPREFAYLWTNIAAMKTLNKRLVANKLSKAGSDKVPYGVGYSDDGKYLDEETLRYRLTEPGHGLSCATYVMAVLKSMGFSPFKYADWQPLSTDGDWQKTMLEGTAAKNPDDKAHFEAEMKNVGLPRIRPEHVTGAGFPEKWPITQAEADEIGGKVVASYDVARPPALLLASAPSAR